VLKKFSPAFFKRRRSQDRVGLVVRRNGRNTLIDLFFLLLFLWGLLFSKEKVIAPGKRLEAKRRQVTTCGELAACAFENVEHFERR